MDSLTDLELLSLASEGNEKAEEELVLRYTRLVRVCSRPYFLAGGDSEDLLQEGLLGLLSAVRSYDLAKGVQFSTFAEVCIRRRLVSAVRAASSDKHSPLNNSVSINSPLFDGNSPQGCLPFGVSDRRDTEEIVLDMVDTSELFSDLYGHLSRFEGKILDFYLDGYSYSEIARATGKPPKAVDNAVQRIRRKLQKLVELRRTQAKT